jgi:hypothetical protein
LTLLTKAAEKAGVPTRNVTDITAGAVSPIRGMEGYEYKLSSRGTILRVSVDYCGADALSSEGAIKASSEWLLKKHPGIGLSEIPSAFDMAANNELGEIDLRAFKGVFTVDIFSRVITAYSEHRNKVLAAVLEATNAQARERQEVQAKEKNEEFKASVLNDYEKLLRRNDRFHTCHEVPWIWGKVLNEAGELTSDPTEWINAKKIVRAKFMVETAAMVPDLSFSVETRKRMFYEMQQDFDCFSDELIEQAKKLYGQILVFKNLPPYVRPAPE